MAYRGGSWQLALSADQAERLPALTAALTFDDVADAVRCELRVLCCHCSRMDGTEFCRPVYVVSVGPRLFDQFFNSSFGYRAAYRESPGRGVDANTRLLRAIGDRLAADKLSTESELSIKFITESLRTPSAKAWLAEHGKEMDQTCLGCKGEWSAGGSGPPELAEILNGKWEKQAGQNAEWGRKAPYLSKLRIMGAFLNDRFDELIPHDKRFRALQIHECGWS